MQLDRYVLVSKCKELRCGRRSLTDEEQFVLFDMQNIAGMFHVGKGFVDVADESYIIIDDYEVGGAQVKVDEEEVWKVQGERKTKGRRGGGLSVFTVVVGPRGQSEAIICKSCEVKTQYSSCIVGLEVTQMSRSPFLYLVMQGKTNNRRALW